MSSGIFPHSWDGGIPPNPETPDNPPQALKPGDYTQPTDTSALYYGLGCDVRIRAPVLNSIISELIGVLELARVAYQAGRLNNLANAISIIAGKGPIAPLTELPVEIRSEQITMRAMQAEITALKKEIAALKNVAPEH